MKKLSFILIIISVLLLSGCVQGVPNEPDFTPPQGSSGSLGITDSLDFSVGTDTTFNITLSGGIEKEFAYGVNVKSTEVSAYVFDGKEKTYSAQSIKQINDFKLNYLNDCNVSGGFDGNLKSCIFAPINQLFKLDAITVRNVYAQDDYDGATAYTIDLYESQVKNALPCLQTQFENVCDVLNLSFIIENIGTTTQITVQIQAKYLDISTPVDVVLTITHRQAA